MAVKSYCGCKSCSGIEKHENEIDEPFFRIGGYEFYHDEFDEYTSILIHEALENWVDGIYTEGTQPNKILDIIIKQVNGLTM